MLRLFIVVVCLATGIQLVAEDFVVDRFTFRWLVMDKNGASMQIEKNEKRTMIQLENGRDVLLIDPAAAEALGKSLANADRIFTELKDDGKVVKGGDTDACSVNFVIDRMGQQNVVVMSKTGTRRLVLRRELANEFAKHLVKSKEMCDFIDRKVLRPDPPAQK